MTYLTLDRVKQHLNIDSYYTDDDTYLASLIDVVEMVVEKHIDYSLVNLQGEGVEFTPPLLHAMLLLIGNFYNTRESVSFTSAYEIPLGYSYLLDLFKDYKNIK